METGKVEFAPDYKSESNKFSDYLAEQMKDPEFAAAYNEVSAVEDKRLLELRRLEREVIEAAKKWVAFYNGSSEFFSDTALADRINALIEFESSQQQTQK